MRSKTGRVQLVKVARSERDQAVEVGKGRCLKGRDQHGHSVLWAGGPATTLRLRPPNRHALQMV